MPWLLPMAYIADLAPTQPVELVHFVLGMDSTSVVQPHHVPCVLWDYDLDPEHGYGAQPRDHYERVVDRIS